MGEPGLQPLLGLPAEFQDHVQRLLVELATPGALERPELRDDVAAQDVRAAVNADADTTGGERGAKELEPVTAEPSRAEECSGHGGGLPE